MNLNFPLPKFRTVAEKRKESFLPPIKFSVFKNKERIEKNT